MKMTETALDHNARVNGILYLALEQNRRMLLWSDDRARYYPRSSSVIGVSTRTRRAGG